MHDSISLCEHSNIWLDTPCGDRNGFSHGSPESSSTFQDFCQHNCRFGNKREPDGTQVSCWPIKWAAIGENRTARSVVYSSRNKFFAERPTL
jgi:hypothetical protein